MSLITFAARCPHCGHEFSVRADEGKIGRQQARAACPSCKKRCQIKGEGAYYLEPLEVTKIKSHAIDASKEPDLDQILNQFSEANNEKKGGKKRAGKVKPKETIESNSPSEGMGIARSLFLKLILLLVALFGYIEFVKWDEADVERGFVQYLPYKNYYRFENEDKGAANADSWHVKYSFPARLVKMSDGQEGCENFLARDEYNIMTAANTHSGNDGLRYAPVWLYEGRLGLAKYSCKNMVDRMESRAQPSKVEVDKANALSRGEALLKRWDNVQ